MKISFSYKNILKKTREHEKRNGMPKITQNLVILMEPSQNAYDIDLKVGNMCLNQFCIDEDNAFELFGVHFLNELTQYSDDVSKGKGY